MRFVSCCLVGNDSAIIPYKKELVGRFQTHPAAFSLPSFKDLPKKIKDMNMLFCLESKMLFACHAAEDLALGVKIRGAIRMVLELPMNTLTSQGVILLDIARIVITPGLFSKRITFVFESVILDFTTALETRILSAELTDRAVINLLPLQLQSRSLDLKGLVDQVFFMKVHLFLVDRLPFYIAQARGVNQPIYLRSREHINDLSRSLLITEQGQRFICFNRKKQGDLCLSSYSSSQPIPLESKVMTIASDLETGERFASAGIKKVNSREVKAMEFFQGKEGFAEMKILVRHPSGGARVLFEMYELGNMATAYSIGTITPRDIPMIFAQVVKSLAYMHQEGWVHGDVKPDNIFLTKKRGFLEVKLGDFGFSYLQTDSKAAGIKRGTVEYASPELAASAPLSLSLVTKRDVWALGASFCRMMSKKFYLQTQSLEKIAVYEEDVKPSKVNSIKYILWRMLRKNPAERVDLHWVLEKIKLGINWSL